MPCYHPITAFQSVKPDLPDGKKSVVFSSLTVPGGGSRNRIFLPCGRCIGCRLEQSRQWAVRMMHESKLHRANCFLTLTYDEENLPYDYSLDKSVMQKFIKRYRFMHGKLRYFAAGEYGDENFRPHYHLCIFGHDFSDKIQCDLRNPADGNALYVSESLNRLWPYGNARIGALTFESAAYVARYVTKKINGEKAYDHYTRVLDTTGEIIQVQPEFAVMSLKPGIGAGWFDKYSSEVYPNDRVIIRGKEAKPPRAYDKLLQDHNPVMFERIKAAREEKAKAACDTREKWLELYDRLPERERFAKAKQRVFSKRHKEF